MLLELPLVNSKTSFKLHPSPTAHLFLRSSDGSGMDIDDVESHMNGPENYTMEAVFGGQSPLSSAPSSYHPSPHQSIFKLPAIGETSQTVSSYSSVGGTEPMPLMIISEIILACRLTLPRSF